VLRGFRSRNTRHRCDRAYRETFSDLSYRFVTALAPQ
jgi:hypothetical protein